MKRIGLLIIAMLALLTLPTSAGAVILVNQQGQPVGGKWQRWADQSHMPIFHMTVGLVVASSSSTTAKCGPHPACVTPWDKPPTIWLSTTLDHARPVYARQDLYHEEGHVFDWYYLTDTTRQQLERVMGDRGQNWAEGGTPNGGASDDFANAYAGCADTAPKLWRQFTISYNWPAVCRIAQRAHYSNTPGAFATGAVP